MVRLESATNEQLKTIIDWDSDCSIPLLYQVFEECVKRDLYKSMLKGYIINFFKSEKNAEKLTRMTMDELKWIAYEQGFVALKKFTPGNRSLLALWVVIVKRKLREIARDNQAQKRSAELVDIDEQFGGVPHPHYNTEQTALNRIRIESIMSELNDTEKEIVLLRYQGYTLLEIGNKQGVTVSGIQKRIKMYLKKIAG